MNIREMLALRQRLGQFRRTGALPPKPPAPTPQASPLQLVLTIHFGGPGGGTQERGPDSLQVGP